MFIEILNLMEVRLNEMSPFCVKPARFENEGFAVSKRTGLRTYRPK